MLTKVENGLLESYKSGTNCLVPRLVFDPKNVMVDDNGISIKKDTFVSKTFPFREFTIVVNISYELLEDSDFVLIYLAKDNRKSGIKIEKNNLSDFSSFKISKTTSCVSIYYLDLQGKWIFVSSFNPPFDFDEFGFYGTVDLVVHEITIYKNPFIRFFIDKPNLEVKINGQIIPKNDTYFLYEYMVEQENENIYIELKSNGVPLENKTISTTYGDVYFFIEKELYIDGLDLENFNIIKENVKTLRLVNSSMKTFNKVKIYSTYEPSLKVYFSTKTNGDLKNSLTIEQILPGEAIEFIIYIEKITPMPYHRYNFNILIE